ncbi:MAG: hypothetical protein EOL92_00455 [Bacteroidia bacterium]|nr:hypothetical protein [Bacteroidia bacterium]
MWRLKEGFPAFEMVDGPFAGRKYERGIIYSDIPENMKDRFEKTTPAALHQVAGDESPVTGLEPEEEDDAQFEG